MRYKEIKEEIDMDDVTVTSRQEVPLYVPGGATVVVLNDQVTPFEVVIEAIVAGTKLSVSEATRRMMQAHTQGWAPVASYPTVDIAETVAYNIETHAANNDRYDQYKRVQNWRGPWPLTCEVMDADQAK
jgi:ATP-dependent Clp protease adapter protein ClpS